MKTRNLCRIAFVLLAAFSIASCRKDDGENVSEADTNRALFEMKKDYVGELKFGLKDEGARRTLEGVIVRSAEELLISIPLDPVADQVKDESVARQLREWKTAKVRATCKFYCVEQDFFSFNLRTEMVPDERFSKPLTRTSVMKYGGLHLQFNQNHTGNYQKVGEALTFNVCVDNVFIDSEPLDGFKPVIFTYGGNAYKIGE
jgi:hypothetical protein